MTDFSIPPSTPLLNAAINDPKLSAEEFRTYAKLYALGTRHKYTRTDPMDFVTEIAPQIGSLATARRHMARLRALGYLDWTSNGRGRYVITFPSLKPETHTTPTEPPAGAASLTDETRSPADDQTSLTDETPGLTNETRRPKNRKTSLKSETPGLTDETQIVENGKTSLTNETPGLKFETQNAPPQAPVPVGSGSEGRIVEGSLINLINLNTYPILSSDARLEKILAATPILFAGESLYRPTKPVTFFVLLAHLAQACHEQQRGVRKKPARAAFNRIKRDWTPEPAYLADPFAYLPVEFLIAAGLEAFIPSAEDAAPADEQPADELPAVPEDLPASEDPSLQAPVSPGGPRAAHAWQETLQLLQHAMPAGAFEQWVRPARLLRYANGGFEVAAPTEYARDWLRARLASTIERHLAGICNRSVAVSFVVVEGR